MADEIQEETPLPAPGVKLKMRREALNLSIEDIAEKIHLRPSVVVELESDVIDHNISMTFTRGYISLYARHLELDPAPLLAEFDELANPVKQPAKLQSFSQKVAKQASDARLMMFSYFVLFVVIAMAVVWWVQQPETSTTTASAPASSAVQTNSPELGEESAGAHTSGEVNSAVPTLASQDSTETLTQSDLVEPQEEYSDTDTAEIEIAEVPARDSSTNDIMELTQSSAMDSVADVTSLQNEQVDSFESEASPEVTDEPEIPVLTASEVIEDNSTESVSTVSESLSEPDLNGAVNDITEASDTVNDFAGVESVDLVFTFAQDCWMNLTDATGETIAVGIKTAGRVMPVSGIPPFAVKLGVPEAVSLTVAGEPFDLSDFPAGRTATFTIGAPQQ